MRWSDDCTTARLQDTSYRIQEYSIYIIHATHLASTQQRHSTTALNNGNGATAQRLNCDCDLRQRACKQATSERAVSAGLASQPERRGQTKAKLEAGSGTAPGLVLGQTGQPRRACKPAAGGDADRGAAPCPRPASGAVVLRLLVQVGEKLVITPCCASAAPSAGWSPIGALQVQGVGGQRLLDGRPLHLLCLWEERAQHVRVGDAGLRRGGGSGGRRVVSGERVCEALGWVG